MKIVINKCYGGFGSLSDKAVERAKELGWKVSEGYSKEGDYADPMAQINISNYGPRIIEDNVNRDDSILIQLVEELGEEAAGRHAQYKVVEIPDDVKWEIEEYDGVEWISEVHRTWS